MSDSPLVARPLRSVPAWLAGLVLALLFATMAAITLDSTPWGGGVAAADEADEPASEPTGESADGVEADENAPADEEENFEDEETPEERRRREAAARAGLQPIDIDPACTPHAGGMILIPAGEATIGSKAATLVSLLAGRPENQRVVFDPEAPEHKVALGTYLFSRTETSNAQFLHFMRTSEQTYDPAVGKHNTLEAIARAVWDIDEREARGPQYRAPWQLYMANKQAIWQAFTAMKRDGKPLFDLLAKRFPNGDLDERSTFEAMRREPLPNGTQLRYTIVRPPDHWDGLAPAEDQLDHPVRGISYNDAERFAEWAGAHVQLEQEYEYAARGPAANQFPWGEARIAGKGRANWGGLVTDPKTYEVRTVSVAGPDPDVDVEAGRSWCGALHLVGNVAELTSSWLKPYPGATKLENRYYGEFIKVFRGGSARDQEWLVMRPAFRGWEGYGVHAPQFPANRFNWVGIRLAAYVEPARDHIEPITRRVTLRKKVRSHWVDPDNYLGAATRDWTPAGASVENHVHIKGAANCVLFLPLKALVFEDALAPNKDLWEKRGSVRAASLKKDSESEYCFLPLGIFHTDVPLIELDVVKPVAEYTEEEKKAFDKAREKSRPVPLVLKPGGGAPKGDYIVGYWHSRIGLFDPNMDLVAFFPAPKERGAMPVDIISVKKDGPPPSTFDLDIDADTLTLSHCFPVGGRKPDPKAYASFRLAMKFQFSGFYDASKNETTPWKVSTPAMRGVKAAPVAEEPADAAPPDEGGPK